MTEQGLSGLVGGGDLVVSPALAPAKIDQWKAEVEALVLREREALVTDEASARKLDGISKDARDLGAVIEEKRVEAVSPFNGYVKQINSQAKELTGPLETLKDSVTGKIKTWRRAEQARIDREAALALAHSQELLEQAVDTEDEDLLQQAQDKAAEARAGAKLSASVPKLGRKSTPKYTWKIDDHDLIPREWLMVNEKALNAASKMQPLPTIPGLHWELE